MIVALDTSSAISVAITDDEAIDALARESVFSPRGHAELLSELIRRSLTAAGGSRALSAHVLWPWRALRLQS